MSRYAVALGSNLGDRIGYLTEALESLEALGEVPDVSGLYETAPVGGPEQGPYLNAVVLLDSPLPPADLLALLQGIEHEAGRERAVRWGARTLDLDIVTSDGETVGTADLQIPHQHAAERRFVLRPLCDVWPDALVGDGVTASDALASAGSDPVDLLSRSWWGPDVRPVGRYWVAGQFVLFLMIAVALALGGSLPSAAPQPTRVIGGALTIVGGLLAFLSMRKLGNSLTALPEPLEDAQLIETGPYGLARHPIYGGVFLFLLGTALFLDSLSGALLSIGLAILFWFKSGYEEKRLRMRYSGYRAYQDRVTRRMVPFLL